MKRTMLLVAGLAFLTAGYFGSQLGAQTAATTAQAPAATKVGVVNIGAVFMKYQKAQFFKSETEQILKPFKDEGEKWKKIMIEWQKALTNPESKLTAEQRAQGEKTIIDGKRRLEDLEKEARTKIGKRNEEQIVQLYREINDAVRAYASANGFHLIFGYGEPMDTDLFTFMNITRKMQAMDGGGVIPMYQAPGLDISQEVVDTLNRSYRGPAVPTSAATTTPR